MLAGIRAAPAFGWRTSYELQVFRNGHWTITSVFDGRGEALNEARRLDRAGKMVRVREDSTDKYGKGRGARTIYLSTTIKNTWKDERKRFAARGIDRDAAGSAGAAPEPERTSINPYYLSAVFLAVVFVGLFAIFGLRSLYGTL